MPPERVAPLPPLNPGGRLDRWLQAAAIGRLSAVAVVMTLWAMYVGVQLALRPTAPIDETRLIAVAWEMWTRGDWLVPYLNGVPYSHKPPLFAWLIMSGWTIFGVNEWWPRLLPGLCGLASIFLVGRIAQRLWPDDRTAVALAPIVVAGTCLIGGFSGVLYYDMPFTFLAALGAYGALDAARGQARRGFTVFALAIGLGILMKGPAILLHTLFLPLLAPLWTSRPERGWTRWYLAVLLAFGLGIALALAWAVPAALHGGEKYAHEIFWGQTANRMVESFAHRQPFWFYVAALPVMLLPWSMWPPVWAVVKDRAGIVRDMGARFGLVWFIPALIAFSLVSGKQVQYLMPSLLGLLLLIARSLANREGKTTAPGWLNATPALLLIVPGAFIAALPLASRVRPLPYPLDGAWTWPGWVMLLAGIVLLRAMHGRISANAILVAAAGTLAFVLTAAAGIPGVRAGYDMRALAMVVRQLQEHDVPVAHVGKYQGQLHIAGRLRKNVESVTPEKADAWLAEHPGGRLIGYPQDWKPAAPVQIEFSQPYRNKAVVIWRANPSSVDRPHQVN